MSYNKRTWVNGNVVGAVDLNRMEEGVESGQNGYECNQVQTVLTEESVTPTGTPPIAYLVYSELISPDSIAVTFDDVEYVLERITGQTPSGEPAYVYGDASTPFVIFSTISPSDVSERNGIFISSSSGTHAITIEAVNVSVEVSDGFKRAVKFVSGGSLLIEGGDAIDDALNHTFAEIRNAMASGNGVIFHFVPTQATELNEFYTQNVRVVNSSSVRQVIVQYDSSEEVTYTASSDDAHPSIRLE